MKQLLGIRSEGTHMGTQIRKAGIFTLYHDNANFGAILQAYALQRKIGDCDGRLDVSIVDFCPKKSLAKRALRKARRLITLIFHPWEIPDVFRRRVGNWKKDLIFQEYERLMPKRKDAFDRFCQNHMNVTEELREKDLPSYVEKYDILIAGSDQIWNPSLSTEAYFLPFRKDGIKKVAYAASISRPSLTRKEKEIFCKWLPDFDCVTVREREGKELLESFLDVDVDVVLDPTMFLTSKDWDEVAEPITIGNQTAYREGNESKLGIRDGYILFYALGADPSSREIAASVANRLGMCLVILSTSLGEMRANRVLDGKELVVVSPGQFVTLVRGSSLVITNSFHGSVFSILYRKNFYVLRRQPDSESSNMNSRIYALLGELGLGGQLVESGGAEIVQIRDDLYVGVEERLEALRRKSIEALRQMLAASQEGDKAVRSTFGE